MLQNRSFGEKNHRKRYAGETTNLPQAERSPGLHLRLVLHHLPILEKIEMRHSNSNIYLAEALNTAAKLTRLY